MSWINSNQADLFDNGPCITRGKITFDDNGYERTKRRNGSSQCPKCGAWWPNIEEPCGWTADAEGRMRAIEWWGDSFCMACDLLMVDQPDGESECYQL